MRIVLDVQGAQTSSRFRGIGRYSLSFAKAIALNARQHDIWLVCSAAFPETILDISRAFDGLIPRTRIRVFDVPTPVLERDPGNAWRMRAAEKIRESFLLHLAPDIVHVSSLFEGYVDDGVTSIGHFTSELQTAVTLYDLIPLFNPDGYLIDHGERDYYSRKIRSLKQAELLFAISEHTRQQALEALHMPEERVINISAAVDERFRPIALQDERIEQLRNRYGISRKMVLYAPGGFDERKNFENLLDAYSLLSAGLRAEYQLVIVGKAGEVERGCFRHLRKRAGLRDDELVLPGYVSDDDLIAFYNLATLFVFPSTHEGFGLPALEAMACGVPTIGSNITSIPEVIGRDDALFDPASVQSIAQKMAQVLSDAGFQMQLREHGLRHAKQFSWDTSAKRAISAFESLELRPVGRKGVQCDGCDPLIDDALGQAIADIGSLAPPSAEDLKMAAGAIAFNTGDSVPKQLLLDISVIVHGDAKSGIQRVVRSLLIELLNNPVINYKVSPIYFDGHQYRYATKFTASFLGESESDVSDSVAEFNQDDVYLALDLNAHLTQAIHPFHMRLQCIGLRLYFIVYDILLMQHPDWWPVGTSSVFEQWLKSITQVATGLICISDAVANDVCMWLAEHPSPSISSPTIDSFHLGADMQNSVPTSGMPDDGVTMLEQLGSRISFLSVGTIEPRKGHAQTLAAFEHLWELGADINLVIVGKPGWLVDSLVTALRQHPELNKRLFWLEGISDEYLDKIYGACTCLIAASEGEGFGLPLIEAAQHHKPIIARDLPVFREVAGEHAFYFSGLMPEMLADAINGWLSLWQLGTYPSSEGLPYLSWRESARQLKAHLNLDDED